MALPGPLPVQNTQPTAGNDLPLRLFQRITAEIMEVKGTQVVLSYEGYPVVARMASADQAKELTAHRLAQFIVTSLSSQEVVLKLAAPNKAPVQTAASPMHGAEVAARLLKELGLPTDDARVMLARAALSMGLPVSADLLAELQAALGEVGSWGFEDAQLAAAIKAAGLPLSSSVLALAGMDAKVGESALRLISLLRQALQSGKLSPELSAQLRANLSLLQESMPQWNAAPEALAESLQNAAQVLGRSIENILSGHLLRGTPLMEKNNLLSFARLQGSLEQSGEKVLSKAVGQFLDDARQAQLASARADPVPGKGEWNTLNLLLKVDQKPREETFPARVKVARREGANGKVDPSFTQVVIQVEVGPKETMQVELSLAGVQIRAGVTAPGPDLFQRSREELPGLVEQLTALGYQVAADVSLGRPKMEPLFPVEGDDNGLQSIDIGV